MLLPDDNTLPVEAGNIAPPLHGPPSVIDDDGDKKKRKWSSYFDQNLLMCKTFYFLFYGAYGSLYPLLAVYFKQLGLNASQSGLLIGIRPFIEFCAAPLWGGLADSWRKAKVLFLFSLFAWLIFTEAMAFIRPADTKCVIINGTGEGNHEFVVDQIMHNGDVHHYRAGVQDDERNGDRAVPYQSDIDQPFPFDDTHRGDEFTPPAVISQIVNYTTWNGDPIHRSPIISGKLLSDNVRGVFLFLLIIIVVGEFFSSPTITLADSATLGYLGNGRLEYYGQQRMFGSLGWGIFMLIEGIILDHTATHVHSCVPGVDIEVRRNYFICFGTYAVLITGSFFVATQFNFKYHSDDDHKTELTKLTYSKEEGQVSIGAEASKAGPASYGSVFDQTEDAANIPPDHALPPPDPDAPGTSSASSDIDAESAPLAVPPAPAPAPQEDPASIRQVFRMYATVRYGSVLCVAWFTGFGMGLLFTFLFWHLQDLGGPPSLFGLASVVNHVSETLAYFFSHKILQAIGHIPVFCLGLFCYSVRFIAISLLINPWWVLIVEVLQGLTHALMWAACTSYIGLATSQRLRSSAQGILQGTHHGLGRGCGAIFGGLLVNTYGTRETFRGFGVASLVMLLIFLAMQYPSYIDAKATASKPAAAAVQPVLTAEDITEPSTHTDQQRGRLMNVGGVIDGNGNRVRETAADTAGAAASANIPH